MIISVLYIPSTCIILYIPNSHNTTIYLTQIIRPNCDLGPAQLLQVHHPTPSASPWCLETLEFTCVKPQTVRQWPTLFEINSSLHPKSRPSTSKHNHPRNSTATIERRISLLRTRIVSRARRLLRFNITDRHSISELVSHSAFNRSVMFDFMFIRDWLYLGWAVGDSG